MKIMIDIGHPGHVHLFRPFAQMMMHKGHNILFTCRQKEFEIELLEAAGLPYKSFGKHYKSKKGKLLGLIKFDFMEIIEGLKFKPDVLLSHGSIYAAHAAWFLRKPHLSMEDTGNMEQIRLYLPFTKCVLTSYAFQKDLGKKQITYKSFHELAYLHPRYFNADKQIHKVLNIDKQQPYVIIRFISWNATHDEGQKGLDLDQKVELVELLSKKYKVFVSAEGDLPDELVKYKIQIPPEKMHDALAFASLFVGEGATMASECAVLGTPAIYINSMEAGTIDEQEKNNLLFHFRNGKGVIEKVTELLTIDELKIEWNLRKQKFLSDKIDLSSYLVWFVENYPKSFQKLRQDNTYQNNFV